MTTRLPPDARPRAATRVHAAAIVTTILLALAPSAAGDILHANDVVAGASATLEVGQSSTARIHLVASNNVPTNDLNGCNAGGLGSGNAVRVYLNSSAPSKVTVASPGYVTIETCDNTGTTTTIEGNATIGYSVVGGSPGDVVVLYANATGGKPPSGGEPALYENDTIAVTIAAPPAPVDTTPPEIAYALSPASPDGTNGWYTSSISIDWSVWDNESTITSTTGCVDETISTDTTGLTRGCSVTSAGGTNSSTTPTLKRDATKPAVSLVGGPADGASYVWGSVPAAPTCSASDATSGLASACGVSGYATSVGTHTVTASATDNASNSNSSSATYTVLAWTTLGFYAPANDALNTVKAGATVPLKFELFAGATEVTDTTGLRLTASQTSACSSGTPDDVEQTATGGTTLRYDATAGQFVQNWQTPKGGAGQCWAAALSGAGVDPAQPIVAYFRLK